MHANIVTWPTGCSCWNDFVIRQPIAQNAFDWIYANPSGSSLNCRRMLARTIQFRSVLTFSLSLSLCHFYTPFGLYAISYLDRFFIASYGEAYCSSIYLWAQTACKFQRTTCKRYDSFWNVHSRFHLLLFSCGPTCCRFFFCF